MVSSGSDVVDQSQHRTLPLTVRVLEVGQECEPKEPAEPDIDWSQSWRYEFEVDSGQECPDTDASLEE